MCNVVWSMQVTVKLLKQYLDALWTVCRKDRTEAEGSRETFYQEGFLLAERSISFYAHVGFLIIRILVFPTNSFYCLILFYQDILGTKKAPSKTASSDEFPHIRSVFTWSSEMRQRVTSLLPLLPYYWLIRQCTKFLLSAILVFLQWLQKDREGGLKATMRKEKFEKPTFPQNLQTKKKRESPMQCMSGN